MKEHQHISCQVAYPDCRCNLAEAKTEKGNGTQELVTTSFRVACFFIDQLCGKHSTGAHVE